MSEQFAHIAVMPDEVVALMPKPSGEMYRVVDCTSGGGGHLGLILSRVADNNALVIGLDRDDDALAHLRTKFSGEIDSGLLVVEKSNFSHVDVICRKHGIFGQVDFIYADLGVSSHQLDTGARGFSVHTEAPLDMRMDTTQELTAFQIVNAWGEEELANAIYQYGEEPQSRRIASAIVRHRNNRPIQTTTELANIIKAAVSYKGHSKRHPAIKSFQALRIVVNSELDQLSQLINNGFAALRPGGRLAIITFHSLEDRIVKTEFKRLAGKLLADRTSVRHLPITSTAIKSASACVLKPFPVKPGETEIEANRRARSAKLRGLEKLI